jgi:hypothetical protein
MNVHEDTSMSRVPSREWKKLESRGAADPATTGGSGDYRARHVPGRGSTSLRRLPYVDSLLAQSIPTPGMARTQRPQTRATATLPTDWATSGDDSAAYPGSLSRSTQIAVCPVDAAGSGRTDWSAVRHLLVGLDDWEVSQTLGFYPAEAVASSVSTRPEGGAGLARSGLSGDTTAGQEPASRNPLGRRDGPSLGLSDRTQLRTQGTDAGNSRHWSAFRMQYDFDADQSRPAGLYGLSGKIHRGCNDSLFATPAAAQRTKGVLDCRQPSGTRVEESRAMGTKAFGPPADVFPARLQPGIESGRVSQSGRQEQRGRPSTSKRSAANDAPSAGVFAWHSATAS